MNESVLNQFSRVVLQEYCPRRYRIMERDVGLCIV